jgi:hypothetical protein
MYKSSSNPTLVLKPLPCKRFLGLFTYRIHENIEYIFLNYYNFFLFLKLYTIHVVV